jgi:hypothetical protein
LAERDARARAATGFAAELRERHRRAALGARRAVVALRDSETQAERMVALRATYADDVSKLTMIAEAHRLLDPVRALHPEADGSGPADVAGELRAARARLAEATAYLTDLERDVPRLRSAAERAQEAEARAAADLDTATAHAVTPFLAQRDALARRREDAIAAMQRAAGGLGLAQALERRAADLTRTETTIAALRE